MKELIAFIILGIVVAVLIEINEHIKAKRAQNQPADCPQEQPANDTACSGCSLVEVCEKEEKRKNSGE